MRMCRPISSPFAAATHERIGISPNTSAITVAMPENPESLSVAALTAGVPGPRVLWLHDTDRWYLGDFLRHAAWLGWLGAHLPAPRWTWPVIRYLRSTGTTGSTPTSMW